MCWTYQIIYWNHLLAFGPILLELWSENPWYPCWTTSLKWGGCYTSSSPCNLSALLWTPCPTPTHSSWYPFVPWRVGIMMWSRGWIYDLQFLSRFHHKWRSRSSIKKYSVWLCGYIVWNKTSSCFTSYTWCLSILRVYQVAPFLKWQRKLRLHNFGCWKCLQN